MRAAIWLTVGAVFSTSAVRISADEVFDAKKALKDHGIRVVGTGLALSDEFELNKSLRGSSKLKKALSNTGKTLAALNTEDRKTKRIIVELKKRSVQFNVQLTNVNPNNVTLNNKLVGAINAIAGQIDLLILKQETIAKLIKSSRQAVNKSRENYIQHVLDMRTLADKIDADYKAKAADKKVQAAVSRLNQASGKKYELVPSRSLLSKLRRLKSLEDTVLSESIPLRKSRSDSLYVSVVVNGKHTQEMVVDSGASLISLPLKTAESFGLKPGAGDETILLILADGRTIQAKLMKLSEVRVGKFTLKDVECAVLGPEAVAAQPLLGMSFLGHFKFEIDAQAETLTMVKVQTSSSRTSRTSRKKKP
jgi:aspartyl protease family protein